MFGILYYEHNQKGERTRLVAFGLYASYEHAATIVEKQKQSWRTAGGYHVEEETDGTFKVRDGGGALLYHFGIREMTREKFKEILSRGK